ncbi:MAG: methoxymalonyl-ACP biosynthesis protein [Sphingobium sp.]|nr:MAG: methoxymalonyl-ACP biosynthesis protein [Sphingobium sp.]
MFRSWLPVCEEPAAAIREALAQPDGVSRVRALKSVARHDLDFPSTMRLDKSLARERAALGGAAAEGFQPVRLAILSTSTTSHLSPGIRVAGLGRGLMIDIYEPDYGQMRQELVDRASGLHRFAPTAVLFAPDPYTLFGVSGAAGIDNAQDAAATVSHAVEGLRRQWAQARDMFGATVLQQLPFNIFDRLMGENETRLPGSPFSLIRAFQSELRSAADADGVDIVDLQHWTGRQGLAAWHSHALWCRAKQEVHPTITPLYGDLVARLLAARAGKSAKCLVLDLDNTVWGGVIGDDGMEGIVIGQGSAVGEGHLAFQTYARMLARRGVILAVCSKNDDAVAREPFKRHPDMVLKLDDIACFVANWTDKATNLRRIAKELNIGIDTLVFADDNPFERNLIRQEIPDIFVPELTDESSDYAGMVADSGFFESVALTKDDLAKTEQYQSNARRQALLDETTDLDGYLAALDMTLKHQAFDDLGVARVTQLINKTNQFNLTTRRYTEPEVRALLDHPGAITRQIRLTDKFGDNGIISVIIGKLDDESRALEIETWLMSCRVLGRQVEQAALNVLVEAAQAAGAETVIGAYIPTDRNSMVKDHYANLGFQPAGEADGMFRWSLQVAGYTPFSTHIDIEAIA